MNSVESTKQPVITPSLGTRVRRRRSFGCGMANHPELFWAKVRIGAPGECWPWTGAKHKLGYGRIHRPGSSTEFLAHRLALAFSSGRQIQEGLQVLHSCDNPPCCNPAHLRVGTHQENMRDRGARNRSAQPQGERNGRAILQAEQVLEIRRQFAARIKHREIAKRFGVSESTVKDIGRRLKWRHL